jgi:HSP20 family molecular chaperone IbpA
MTMTAQEIQPKEKQEVQEPSKTRPGRYYVPDVDIYEDENMLRLWVDMPGVAQDQVSVDLDDNVLNLQGEVSLDDYKGLSPIYTEYNVGHFSRRFTLPQDSQFERDRIAARMSDGVLEVQIPKAERAKPRKITVTT